VIPRARLLARAPSQRAHRRVPLRTLTMIALLGGLVGPVRAEPPRASTLRSPAQEPRASTLRSPAQEPRASTAPLLVRLAPSAEQRERTRAAALEQRLVRLLSALPEVERAEVSVELPLASLEPLDQPARSPRVTAVVTVASSRSQRQTHATIEHIVSGVLPGLSQGDLTLIERPRAPDSADGKASEGAHSLVQIGPFLVHRRSAPGLRAGLAALLATNALLAAILLWRTRLVRSRSARQTES
jgi:hypothetical protein